MNKPVVSGKKSSSSSTPYEADVDLRSIATAKILLALGEGEFEGGVDGKDIYLDGTPLISENGTSNFSGVSWAFRPGTVDQDYIPGFPGVESETSVGVELTSDVPWVRSITDSQLSAVVIRFSWPALRRQKSNGDLVGYEIKYRIEVSTDGGPYEVLADLSISGYAISTYERSTRVNLPEGSSWVVRVVRITPNQNDSSIADTMNIAAITEVIDLKLRYPNTALLGVEFDASQFNNIPTIAVHAKMRKVRVPDNYDPEERVYSGTWTGGFKYAYTNNPAWVTYDLIVENRFSIGDRVGAGFLNKFELYDIARYCDQLVSDGKGGMEHRYECNIYLQTATEAWQVLRDISAIYRGMVYWMQSQMMVRADMPRDPDYVITNANVIDGLFTYSGSDSRVKYTRALVSWDDPDNAYETDVTTTYDDDLQIRYGDNVVELSAYGCTRESEAQRRGKWAIYTNNNDRTVSFKMGMDGEIPQVGNIISVADKLISGSRIGGRISEVSSDGLTITVDSDIDFSSGSTIRVNLPSGISEARTIFEVSGRDVVISTPFSETPERFFQWVIESDALASQHFQIISAKKSDSDTIEYEFTGVAYNLNKFDYVDSGARLEERPVSNLPVGGQAAPSSVLISQSIHVEQTMAVTTMTIKWDEVDGAVSYDVQWRRDYSEWVSIPRTGQLSTQVKGVYTGQYIARVRAINAAGTASVPASSALTDITGKNGEPPALALFTTQSKAFSIQLNWAFSDDSEDTLYTEIEYADNSDGNSAQTLGNYAYPDKSHELSGLAAGVEFWFRARILDRTGNVSAWTAWVRGVSSTSSDEILSYLEGKIGTGELAPGLIEQIGDGIASDINIEVDQKISEVNETISALSSDVNQKIDQTNQVVSDLSQDVNSRIDSSNQAVEELSNTVNQRIDETSQAVSDLSQDVNSRIDSSNQAVEELSSTVNQRIDETSQAVSDLSQDVNSRIDSSNQAVEELSNTVNQRIDETNQTVSNLSGDINDRIDDLKINFEEKIDGIGDDLIGYLSGDDENSPEDVLWYAGDDEDQDTFVGNVSITSASNQTDYSQAKSISIVGGRVANNEASIARVDAASATRDEALSQSIAQITATVGDNSAAILAEQTARADADSALATDVNALTSRVGTTESQISTEASTRASADEALGSRIDTVTSTVGDNSAAILAEQTARANADSALAQDIDALTATVGDNSAAILAEQTARADADSALATDVNALTSRVGTTESQISTEASTRASADEALGSRIDTVTSTVGDNSAAILAEQTARTNADSALAQDIDALTATVGDNSAAILAEQTARADADSALATDVNALTSRVGTTESQISTEASTRASADEALGSRIDTITSTVGDNSAAILAEQTARANADSALAQDIDALTATVGDNSAAIINESEVRTGQVSELDSRILDDALKMFGFLSGDDSSTDERFQWYAGDDDDEESFVGNVSATSASNERDYSLARQINTLKVSVGASEAAITDERLARVSADDALAESVVLVTAKIDDSNAAILAEQTARANADSALAQDIDALTATVGDNSAAILAEQTARADADSALATDVNALTSRVGTTESQISTEASTRASADEALGSRIDTVTSTVGDNSAAILAEQTARANADSALAQDIDALTATVGDNSAAILAEQTARADADSALATDVNALTSRVGTTESQISTEASTRASADEALGSRIDTVTSTVGDNSAAILAEQTARTNADSALAQDIDALTATVGDNSAAILAEQTARADADSALATDVNALTSRVGTTESQISTEASTRASADEALGSRIDTITSTVGDNSAAILAEQTARANADSALAQDIDALTATVGDNSAAIINESEVRTGQVSELDSRILDDALKMFGFLSGDDSSTDERFQWYAGDDDDEESFVGNVSATSASNERDYSLARQINTLKVSVGASEAAITDERLARVSADDALAESVVLVTAKIDDSNAAILAEQTARANADSALAQDIDALTATVGDNSAAILAEQTARADADSALATDVNALTSRVGTTESQISTEASTRASADEALGSRIDTITSTVGDNSAAILAEQTARANADSALAQDIDALTATVGDNSAAILSEQTARADADSALAQDIQTLTATIDGLGDLGGIEATVQQVSETVANLDGAIKANWQVKTQVRADGKVVQAGVALGASIGEGGESRSEFLIMADTIGFLNSIDGKVHAPFVFDTVNDTAVLNSAIIGDASIGAAKFTEWLESEAVNEDGNPILRLNFVTGEIQLNASSSGGGRMTLNNEVIQVYDENNTLRVRLGIW